MENTQRHLQLQEQIEVLADSTIEAVEVLEAQAIGLITNNDFNAANAILDKLTVINETLSNLKGGF